MNDNSQNLTVAGIQEQAEYLIKLITEGKEYILPERHVAWEDYVMTGSWGSYHIANLIVDIMKVLSTEGSIDKASEVLNEGNLSGFEAGYVRNAVLNFSILGHEFCKANIFPHELTGEVLQTIEEKRNENYGLALKHYNELSPGVVKTLVEKSDENSKTVESTISETETTSKHM